MPGRRRGLIRLGTFIRRQKSGTLVLAVDRIPLLGESVFDSELREIGSIVNVLGPISYPMVEVRAKEKANPPGEAAFYLLE